MRASSLTGSARRRGLETTRAIHFTGRHDHGHGLYSDGVDTFISSNAESSTFGTAEDIQVDDPVGASEQQGLVKFGNIFGTGTGQIPKNKRIVQAILTLTTEGLGSTSTSQSGLYRLRIPFDEKSTWSSAAKGIQIGTDTLPTPDARTFELVDSEGTSSFDVTSSLRSWQAGMPNHGWAMLNSGDGSWSFRSQDWAAPAERPMLTVIYER